MTYFWNISYVNINTLSPGQAEIVPLPERISTSGVIKSGVTLKITDVQIRSVSTPLENDPSCHMFVVENGAAVSWLLPSFSAREGWHGSSPLVIEGDESLGRSLIIVAASLAGVPDRYIVTLVGSAEIA